MSFIIDKRILEAELLRIRRMERLKPQESQELGTQTDDNMYPSHGEISVQVDFESQNSDRPREFCTQTEDDDDDDDDDDRTPWLPLDGPEGEAILKFHCSVEGRVKAIVQRELLLKVTQKEAEVDLENQQHTVMEKIVVQDEDIHVRKLLLRKTEDKYKEEDMRQLQELAAEKERLFKLQQKEMQLESYLEQKMHEQISRASPIGESCSEESLSSGGTTSSARRTAKTRGLIKSNSEPTHRKFDPRSPSSIPTRSPISKQEKSNASSSLPTKKSQVMNKNNNKNTGTSQTNDEADCAEKTGKKKRISTRASDVTQRLFYGSKKRWEEAQKSLAEKKATEQAMRDLCSGATVAQYKGCSPERSRSASPAQSPKPDRRSSATRGNHRSLSEGSRRLFSPSSSPSPVRRGATNVGTASRGRSATRGNRQAGRGAKSNGRYSPQQQDLRRSPSPMLLRSSSRVSIPEAVHELSDENEVIMDDRSETMSELDFTCDSSLNCSRSDFDPLGESGGPPAERRPSKALGESFHEGMDQRSRSGRHHSDRERQAAVEGMDASEQENCTSVPESSASSEQGPTKDGATDKNLNKVEEQLRKECETQKNEDVSGILMLHRKDSF